MTKRLVFLWVLTLAPVFGATAVWAQTYAPTASQTAYYAGEAAPAAQPAPAAVATTADTACGCTAPCSSCTAGFNTCGCNDCGACFNWDQDTWVKVGAGLRTTYNYVDSNLSGPGGNNTVQFFNPDNMRLYFNGQGHKVIGFELNTEIADPASTFTTPNNLAALRLLDGVVKFQFDDLVNVWMGRFLPPSDRSNLSGPFYLNAWDYPFVSNYPSIFDGRDNGVAYWGQVGGGVFKWQVGVFNGTTPGAGNGNSGIGGSSDNLEFTGRLTLNLLDPEPGYYNQSTYYGKKDILAIGAVIYAQKDAVGNTATGSRDFFGWNVDFLFEKKLANDGVITVEGAYYDYNDHANGSTDSYALTQQGKSGFVEVSYLFPQLLGFGKMCGQIQPFSRWQEYDHEFANDPNFTPGQFSRGLDVGANYIIYGHNARLTAFWGERDLEGGGNYSIFRTGAQVQF